MFGMPAEFSDDEMVIVENAFERVMEAIAEDNSPEAQTLKEIVVEAQQVVSSKIEGSSSGKQMNEAAPSGPGV